MQALLGYRRRSMLQERQKGNGKRNFVISLFL
jgi:hypothetical protein